MIDPELKTYLENIQKAASQINKKTGGTWGAFFRGMLGGIGSVVGVALVILLIGWILNFVGVIPAFRDQVEVFKQTLEDIKKIR